MEFDFFEILRRYAFLTFLIAMTVVVGYQSMRVKRTYVDPPTSGPRIAGANPDIPLQWPAEGERTFRDGEFTISTLAGYDIFGIVVAKAHYNFDAASSISWMDVGIAFGDFLRKPELLTHASFSEDDRTLSWQTDESFYQFFEKNNWQISNNHLIFLNHDIAETVEKASVGGRIRLKGYLISAKADGVSRWTSSLTRYDHGCEIILVTDARVSN